MRFTNQFVNYAFDWLLLLHGPIGTLFTNWLVNSNMSFRTSQRTCELRNEVRNICGQSFVKSTVKSSPGWGIFHSQLAQGPCISLQVVSRHPGIYTIITNQIKCPGVFPGGGGWLLLELTHALARQPGKRDEFLLCLYEKISSRLPGQFCCFDIDLTVVKNSLRRYL